MPSSLMMMTMVMMMKTQMMIMIMMMIRMRIMLVFKGLGLAIFTVVGITLLVVKLQPKVSKQVPIKFRGAINVGANSGEQGQSVLSREGAR